LNVNDFFGKSQKGHVIRVRWPWVYDHRGGVVRYFDKASRSQLLRHLGQQRGKALENQLDAYLVVSTGGQVITVGHRYKRINRN
jgi:hypothetical protein